jgi:hypothetical protein
MESVHRRVVGRREEAAQVVGDDLVALPPTHGHARVCRPLYLDVAVCILV